MRREDTKVVHVLFGMKVGGMQRQLVRLLPGLKAGGLEQEVVCFSEKGPLAEELEAQGIKCHLIELDKKGWSPAALWSFLNFSSKVGRLKPSLLHLHGYPGNVRAAQAALLLGVPYILHYRNEHDSQGPGERAVERVAVAKASSVAAVSFSALVSVEKRIGALGRLSMVLTNGVDPVEPLPPRGAEGKKRVGLVCRLAPQKRVKDFLEAAHLTSQVRSDTEWLHVGGGRSRRVQKIRRFVRRLKLSPFKMLGERGDTREIMGSFHIGVLTSEREGMPNVLLEYLSVGLPVVATHIPPVKEVVVEGKTGLLVPVGDTLSLSKAFNVLLDQPLLRKRMGFFARRRARFFGMDRAVSRTLKLYRTILSDEVEHP